MINMHDHDRYRTFTRRTAIMATGGLAMIGSLLARMYYLQVIKAEKYTMLADENRISVDLIPPLRGKIYDRFGEVLATNRRNFKVEVVPAQVKEKYKDIDEALDDLTQYIPISDWRRTKIKRAAARQSRFQPVTVAEHLTFSEFSRVNFHLPYLAGFDAKAGSIREYPHALYFAHVLGYMNEATEEEADDDGDPVLLVPGFRIGRRGIEETSEHDLRGTAGTRQSEVNAFGRRIRELNKSPQTPGNSIVLTIDANLQKYAMERISQEVSGAAVLMDVRQGDILALASEPGYDPNEFVVGLSQAKMDQYRTDKRHPLFNKAVQGVYPPGSTFKMITGLAALEQGVMTPHETVYCGGHTRLGNRNFHCWKRGGHGQMNMKLAHKHSCDVYFYEAAKRTGIDNIKKMAEKMGLNKAHNFGIPGEKNGLVPNRGWKIANFGEPWQQGETLIAGIGQGYITASPVQLAVMTARIANGEQAVRPRIIRSVGGEELAVPKYEPLNVPKDHIDIIRSGMNAVTNEIGGTAWRSRIQEKGLEMAGKTGTSQVRRITAAERATRVRKNEELPWELRDHALFVAYAPVVNPVYAISVFVEHGGGGSSTAAPIAHDIMQRALFWDPMGREAVKPVVAEKSRANHNKSSV